YDAGISLREHLRTELAADWPITWANELAAAYTCRGLGKGKFADPAAVMPDFDAAITLMEQARDALQATGVSWPPDSRNALAMALFLRALGHLCLNDSARAREDANAASGVQKELVDALSTCPSTYLQLLESIEKLQRSLSE